MLGVLSNKCQSILTLWTIIFPTHTSKLAKCSSVKWRKKISFILNFEQSCDRAGAFKIGFSTFVLKNFNKFIQNQHFIKVASLALSAKKTHAACCLCCVVLTCSAYNMPKKRNEFNQQHKTDKMQQRRCTVCVSAFAAFSQNTRCIVVVVYEI